MLQNQNNKEFKKIGKLIRDAMEATDYSIEDFASLTGFTRKTIISIINGGNTDLVHFIGLAKAIGIQPRAFLNFDFELKPKFRLSPQRLARNLLTKKINKIFSETDFFDKPRLVNEVVTHLSQELNVKTTSTKVSVVLKRMTNEGKLSFKKSGRNNVYSKRKKY